MITRDHFLEADFVMDYEATDPLFHIRDAGVEAFRNTLLHNQLRVTEETFLDSTLDVEELATFHSNVLGLGLIDTLREGGVGRFTQTSYSDAENTQLWWHMRRAKGTLLAPEIVGGQTEEPAFGGSWLGRQRYSGWDGEKFKGAGAFSVRVFGTPTLGEVRPRFLWSVLNEDDSSDIAPGLMELNPNGLWVLGNQIADSSGVIGGGGSLPADAAGYLRNDGAGALSWTQAGAFTTLSSSGDVTIGSNGGGQRTVFINAAAGSARDIIFRTAGVNRWFWRVSGEAETGSDAGSNFALLARTDAGGPIDTVMSITRAAGGPITFNRPVSFAGGGGAGSVTQLNVNTLANNTTSTSETTLRSYTVPGGTLVNTGDRLEIEALVRLEAEENENSKAQLKWGSQVICEVEDPSGSGAKDIFAILRATIIRTGATTQSISGWVIGEQGVSKAFQVAGTQTLSGSVNLTVTGQVTTTNGTANRVSYRHSTVSKHAAP